MIITYKPQINTSSLFSIPLPDSRWQTLLVKLLFTGPKLYPEPPRQSFGVDKKL
jgi:hypothetical protein